MKTPKQSILGSLRRATRSPRSQWLFIFSLLTLGFASRHTLPLRVAGPGYDPIVEIVRSFAAFYIAGLCVALARASLNNPVHVVAIGTINGFYALTVSLLIIGGGVRATQLEVAFGALLAATSTMLGACAGARFSAPKS